MDVQHFLAVNMMVVSALAILLSLMQSGLRAGKLWIAVNLLVIAVGLAALQFAPVSAGSIVACVFVPLVVSPFLLGQLMHRAVLKGNMGSAAILGRVLAILHPTRQFRLNAAVTSALSRQTVPEQLAAFEEIAADANPAERITIRGYALRAQNDWQGLLEHFREHRDEIAGVGSLEVRALGELGRLDEMVQAYELAAPRLNPYDMLEARLFLLANGGRPDAVQDLLKGPLAALGDDAKAYWTSIALRASGAPLATWQEPLRTTLAKSRNKLFKARAERTLNATVIDPASALSPRAAAIVDNVAQRMQQTNSPPKPGLLTTPVTYILLAAIGLVYVLEEMRGGAEVLRVLVDMGAMWPPYVERRGEWWRLITAIFLHLGWLHTLVNAFMLWVLGRPCELSLGSLRMLLVYLLGGVASTGFVLWLALAGYTEPAVLIGASGAIMALFGAIVAHRLVSWLRWRDPLDKRALVLFPAILALQIAVDLATPQVSLAAHASGFVAGFLIGLLMVLPLREPRRVPG